MREHNDAGRGAHEILQLHDKSEGGSNVNQDVWECFYCTTLRD